MDKLRFSDLSDEQKTVVCNGCGPKAWGGLQPPQFIFRASCDQHDFYYWRGGTEKDRKFADKEFYKFMKIDIKEDAPWYKKPHYHTLAWIYYSAVRISGVTCFTYLDEMRTEADLIETVKVYNNIQDAILEITEVEDDDR